MFTGPRKEKYRVAAWIFYGNTYSGNTVLAGISPTFACPDRSHPPKSMDNIIAAQELQIERKHFYIEFRENDRGRFLRITEEAHGRRNTIIVPSTGLEEFSATLNEVLDTVHSSAPAPAA